MDLPLIDHVGFVVADLEAAIEKWERVTGYHFSPIGRYRTNTYADKNNPNPHFHDARITVSKEGPPYVELMEATGSGTHSIEQAGPHHLGFRGFSDVEALMDEFKAEGIDDDGKSINADGRVLLWFTDKSAMDGIRFELISPLRSPTVADDGSELWRDPVTQRHSLWGPPEGTAG